MCTLEKIRNQFSQSARTWSFKEPYIWCDLDDPKLDNILRCDNPQGTVVFENEQDWKMRVTETVRQIRIRR